MATSPWDAAGVGWTYISFDAQHLQSDNETCATNGSSTIQWTLNSTPNAPWGYIGGYYAVEDQGLTGSSVVTSLCWTYSLPTPGLTFTIDTTASTSGWVNQGYIGSIVVDTKTYYQYRFCLAGPITLPWTTYETNDTVIPGSTGIYLKATSNTVYWCDNTHCNDGSG